MIFPKRTHTRTHREREREKIKLSECTSQHMQGRGRTYTPCYEEAKHSDASCAVKHLAGQTKAICGNRRYSLGSQSTV